MSSNISNFDHRLISLKLEVDHLIKRNFPLSLFTLSLSRKSNINTVRVSDSSVNMVEVGRGNLD